MPFSYAVPLSTFQELFDAVVQPLHQELTERIKSEIHADIARRLIGPDIATPTGWGRTYYDSAVAHGDIIFYSPVDYEQMVEKTGAPRPNLATMIFPRQGLKKDPQATLTIADRSWRYPADATGGKFSQAVNAVLSKRRELIKEFKRREREMGVES